MTEDVVVSGWYAGLISLAEVGSEVHDVEWCLAIIKSACILCWTG